MASEWLSVKDFDDPVKALIHLLHHSDIITQGKIKALMFSGWSGEGLGASAIVRATAERLKSKRSDPDTKLQFGKILHVDCSLWKNRRTMQREIAAELNLVHLMPIFDKRDEDDDFRGVDESYRAEITSIASEIHESLINEKFLLILHYGGDADIDLEESGVPLLGRFGKGKLLWTNHGRFQLWPKRHKLMSSFVHISLNYYGDVQRWQQLSCLLHKEAVEVISYTGKNDINPATVVDCFLYSLLLIGQAGGNSDTVDYGWATHACNYWICDGILQGDRSWEVGNALYGVIGQLDHFSKATHGLLHELDMDQQAKLYQGWKSIASNQRGAHSISAVPVDASSYFLTFKGDDLLELPNDLFQLVNNLRVLKLCNCSFDFAFPPFKSCNNLRFLWLDHCANTGKEQGGGACFPNLIVLDLRHTDYALQQQMIEQMTNLREINTKGVSWRNISHAWKTLQNVHKLRLTESSDVITVNNCSSLDMINLELLDLSGNTGMGSLPAMSSVARLKMLVLDGCSNLDSVALEGGLPLLETFSFDGYGPTENWAHPIKLPKKEFRPKSRATPIEEAKVTKISLMGCGRLHNIFLRGLPNLDELDLSGTAIKMFDLTVMDVPKLRKLLLLGCRELCSPLLYCSRTAYHPFGLKVLHMDTWRRKGLAFCCAQALKDFFFEACITLTDARILRGCMEGLYWSTYRRAKVHLHISSTVHSQINMTKSFEEIGPSQESFVLSGRSLPYKDITLLKDVARPSLVCHQQLLQPLDVHVEIGDEGYNLETMDKDEHFRCLVEGYVQSLHVHDNSSIAAIPPRGPQSWSGLRWCHVERCPKLHYLFSCEARRSNFTDLRIFSASDLPTASCIWDKTNPEDPKDCIYRQSAFTALHSIYLHNCPKVVFVLPVSFTLPSLETLHIAYCRNLQYVFPLDNKYPPEIASGATFQNLKHIKLYHLHRLEQICEARLTVPALETVSLRDCWGLRRIPAVIARQGPKPVVDCEKDWWGRLEWDGLEAGHHPSLFKTLHSAYCKEALPRVSVLR